MVFPGGTRPYHNLHVLPTLLIPTIPKAASSSIWRVLRGHTAFPVADFRPDLLEGREIVNLVRDPFDRLASLYAFGHRQWWAPMTFAEFVAWVVSVPDAEADRHFRSQTALLTVGEHRLIGVVFRYERIDDFWAYVQARENVPALPRNNAAPRTKPTYTPALSRLVERRYVADFELLERAN